MEPGSERFVLDNGMTILLRRVRGARAIALTVLYSIGGDHDPAGHSGLTHMVEHIYVTAAAGQAKVRTAEEFAQRYALGANAQTGHRYTVFAAVFAAAELDSELQDAAARMGDLRITPADIERERPRLLEEVDNMFGAMPMLAALNNARELVRPTPAGGQHGGSPEQLRALTLEEVRAYWQRYYKPRNAILSLAGDFDSAVVRKAIETHFARISPGEKAPSPLEAPKPKLGNNRELSVNAFEPNAASVACLAYAAPQPGDALYVPFLVLISRLWAAGSKLGMDGPTGSPVYFTPLDDGSVVAVSTEARPGETRRSSAARTLRPWSRQASSRSCDHSRSWPRASSSHLSCSVNIFRRGCSPTTSTESRSRWAGAASWELTQPNWTRHSVPLPSRTSAGRRRRFSHLPVMRGPLSL